VGLGGTITYANKLRLNPYDTNPINGIMRGIDFANSQFHNAPGNFEYEFEDIDDLDSDGVKNIGAQLVIEPPTPMSYRPFRIRKRGSFPWIIYPQSAIEIAWLDNGVNFTLASALWDEPIL
jgi:hypothetical protein